MTDWTDDLTIPLPSGRTVAEVVDRVLAATLAGTPDEHVERRLRDEFGLSRDVAALARDRSLGGLVRAATGNPANRPDPAKDPLAAESFDRATEDPTLVARIYPQFASDRAAEDVD